MLTKLSMFSFISQQLYKSCFKVAEKDWFEYGHNKRCFESLRTLRSGGVFENLHEHIWEED